MDLRLGALTVRIASVPPWTEALDALVAGFTPGLPTASEAVVPDLVLSLGGASSRPSDARAPSFTPRTPGSPDVLDDLCEAWSASIDLTRRPIAARYALYDGRPDAHVRRELVASSLRTALGIAAPTLGALLLHASALAPAPGAPALAFLGASGEGKSTMVKRLDGWRLLADDACLVTREHICGTPLRGKEGLPRSGTAHRLGGLVILQKGSPTLRLERLTPAEATDAILRRVLWHARAPAQEAVLLDVVGGLAERTPTWRLASSLEHDVAPALTASREAA